MRNPFTLSTAAPLLLMSWYLLGVINLMSLLPVVEAQTCTAFSNTTVCLGCTQPPAGQLYEEYLSCGGCVKCSTTCSSGTYKVGECGPTNNLQCNLCTQCINQITWESTACQGGGNMAQNRVCSACSTCGIGTYRTALCTTISNTQCAACTTCAADQYATTACQANGAPGTNRVCATCTQCTPGVSYQSAPCGGDDGSTDRQCTACPTCTTGFYQASDCTPTATTDCRACSTCGPGTYASAFCTAISDTVCTTCATCGTGQYASQACTPFTNSVCSQCSTGECPAGQYESSPCTATSDRVCSACTTCGGNKYQTAPCTVDSDTECSTCTVCSDTEWASTGCQEGEILILREIWEKWHLSKTLFRLRIIGNRKLSNYTRIFHLL